MLAEVGAGLLRPFLVADAHRLGRARMVLVQLVEDLLPVVGAAQLARTSGELGGELVVGRLSPLSQPSGVEAEELLLAKQCGVALLAERPRAAGVGTHLLEEGDVPVVGRSGSLTGLSQPCPQRAIVDLGRKDLAQVAGTGAGLVCRSIQEDLRHHLRPEVAHSVGKVARDQPHACHSRIDQLVRRPQLMQEQDEDARHARVQVGIGLASPDLEILHDLPPAQDADHEVPVDLLVECQVGTGDGPKSLEPR